MRCERVRVLGMVAAAIVLVLAALLVGRWAWQSATRTPIEAALEHLPPEAQRVSFTDWREVRAALGEDGRVDANSSRAQIETMVDAAYERDLSAASSVNEAAGALQELFGFGPAVADWEALAQSEDGAAMVMSLPGSDFEDIARDLERAGYQKPDQDDGVWIGGVDLVSNLDPTLSPQVQFIVLLADQHLVVSSDESAYAERGAKVAAGDVSTLADSGRADVVGAVKDSAAAIVWTGDFACEDLSMASAGADDRRLAQQLIAQAGPIDPVTGVVMSLATSGTLTVAEGFEDSSQARDNLEPRAKLATGEAVGRGADSFADDYRLTSSKTEGKAVVLGFAPVNKSAALSGLYSGPVIFASC